MNDEKCGCRMRLPTKMNCEGRHLDFAAMLRHEKSSDQIYANPADEMSFTKAAEIIVGAKFLLRMEEHGFDFAFDGKRFKLRTDSGIESGRVICGDICVENWKGVTGAGADRYYESPTSAMV